MLNANAPLNRKLRMGLVGGGGQGFIGKVHALAAALDYRAELVAGALSSDPDKSRASAHDFGIAQERAYGSFEELIEGESNRPAEDRIDFVSIATPNHTHFDFARQALSAGFHVFCDKPLTIQLSEAVELARLVEASGKVFVVTHNYTGYPLVRQARQMIQQGELGEIQAVRVAYIQGWLQGWQPGQSLARGAWKMDPLKAGSGALGDIGTHAYNLARHVTGLAPKEISCQLRTTRPQRELDDYGQAQVRFAGGALGMIVFSQVTHGRLNDLTLEVDGDRGSLVWRQEEPNTLTWRRFGQATQVIERNPNSDFNTSVCRAACRLPGGHPEAFLEAFANVYNAGFDAIVAQASGDSSAVDLPNYPTVYDGVEGVYFVQQCLASHEENSGWLPLERSVYK